MSRRALYIHIVRRNLVVSYDYLVYISAMRAQLSEEIRHAVVGKLFRALPRRILLSFAPSAAAAWHCERSRTPCKDGYMTERFFLGLGFAAVL